MATITAKAIATSNRTYAGWVNGGSITFDDFTSGDKSQDAGSLLVDPSELEKIPTGSIINSVTLYYTSKVNKDNYNAGIYVTPYYLTSYTITENTYTYTGASKAGDKIQSTLSNSTSGYDGNISFGTWDVSKFKSGMRLAMGVKVTRGSWTLTSCDLTISNIRVVIDYTIPTYYLDLNGMLDGSSSGGISPYGTADVYINGLLAAQGVSDYYTAHPEGTTYEIKNIKANEGYKYNGNASYSGTLTAATSVVLSFSTKTACTITYNGNGATSGSVAAQSGYVGDSLKLRDNGFVKNGYTFLGWYTAASGGSKVADGGGSYTPTGDITLYAHWKTNSTNMIYIGTKQPTFYIGTKQVQSIYLGTSLIYEIVTIVDSGTCGSNLTYTLDSHGVLTISGTGDMQNSSFGWDKDLIKSVVINDGVTNIGQGAFEDCTGLTSITIPNGVTSIGWNAFRNCTSLTSITIPDSVTSIGVAAFYRCSGLTSVAIPDSITSIGDIAFWDCNGLTSITIPDRVTSIGEGVFAACNNLTKITVSSGNTVYHSTDNCLIETETKTLISGCKSSIIPTDGSVTSIGNRTFEGCSGLTSVTIPNGVTSIGWRAFWSCFDLTRVIIPNSVTNIGDWAFQSCSCLTSITIPDSVTSIGEGAFNGCTGLTSITIPSSVTSIGDSMFRDCTNLTEIDFSTHTTVPTLNSTNAFSNTPANLVIKVPSYLLDEWKAATNWVAYADKIVRFK